MEINVLKKSDGYWLSIDGTKKALINLDGKYPPIATEALEEAANSCEINRSRGFCACA